MAEVHRQELGELLDAVPAQLADYAPLDAMERWLDRLIEYARVKRGVTAEIEASAWQNFYTDYHYRLDDALAALLDRGKAAGAGRPNVDATDVILLLGALSRIPAEEWDVRARTVVALVRDGLRSR